jgi:hypothetical protein
MYLPTYLPQDGEDRPTPSGTSGRGPTHCAVTILTSPGSGVPHAADLS